VRALAVLLVLVLIGGGAAWVLTAPDPIPEAELASLSGDAARGETLFWASGCASCHAAPDAESSDTPVLSGGEAFVTQFGTFYAPNISPSPAGVGDWTDAQIVNAVMRGVGREGEHLFPALPYTSYIRAERQDMVDVVAFLRTLPPSDAASLPHEVRFPFGIRRALGGWKLLFLRDDWVLQGDLSPEVERGRYLVEAVGHCGECHTPRNALGGPRTDRWLSGAADPARAEGGIPGIDPGSLDWSEAEIAELLKSGFTPDFDTVGGSMAEVVRNTARLPDEDRAAIAAYLKAVPAVDSGS
jgi:mono/diheme cytochrome c family protein